MRLETYSEIPVGNHLLSFGYRLNSFGIGIYVSKHSIDISIFPFFIGLEFNGVLIDQHFSKIVAQRLSEYRKTQSN